MSSLGSREDKHMTRTMTEAEYRERVKAIIRNPLTLSARAPIDALEALAVEAGATFAPERTRIKRGDVIESPKDAERYDVPDGTLFRDRDGDSWEWIDPFKTMFRYAPLRCIDVPNTDGKCPTCSDPSSSFRTRLCPTCFTDYREPETEQNHGTATHSNPVGTWAECLTCGWRSGLYPFANDARKVAAGHVAVQS